MQETDFIKITNAVYKLLDFFPEGDPLKNLAKGRALAVLENLTVFNQGQKRADIIPVVLADIEILENYLHIAKGQGWVNPINFIIITKQYQNLKENVRKQMPVLVSVVKPKVISKPEKLVLVAQEKREETPEPKSLVRPQYSQRQHKILDILRRRPKAQVGDLIKELPAVTKRTVRRDLDELLKRGEIVRAGEWNQVSYQVKR